MSFLMTKKLFKAIKSYSVWHWVHYKAVVLKYFIMNNHLNKFYKDHLTGIYIFINNSPFLMLLCYVLKTDITWNK